MIADELDLLPPPEEELVAPPDEELVAGAADEVEPFDEDHDIAAPAELVAPLVELLPADFPLPALIKFVPDARVRAAADQDAERLLGIEVTDETSMRVVDACLDRQRAHKKTIEGLFDEPTSIANQLHKRLTSLRAEWLEPTERAIKAAGQRIVETQRRLEREAADERRTRQEEADRIAREQAQREADAARQAQAPPEVVQQLETEARTATAPPLPLYDPGKTALKSTSVVSTWKPRLKGTESSGNQQPGMADLTPAQKVAVLAAMKAVIEGRGPLQVFEISWTYANARARADKKAFNIEGFEPYEDGSTRGKAGRRA